jgi:hypothetical protein
MNTATEKGYIKVYSASNLQANLNKKKCLRFLAFTG